MNFHFTPALATLGCLFLASCYPYDESRNKKVAEKPAEKTVTSPEQQKLQQQRDQLKAQQERDKREALESTEQGITDIVTTTQPSETTKPPVEEKRAEYSFANKVPGKEGFVFSPYNNKVVDVRDIPSGTLVKDPTYTGTGKGYFRVP